MKIPHQLNQFASDNAFVVVAGRQDAIFYQVENGNIFRLDAFKVPTPHYSDREGEFKTRGHGIVVRSGAVREIRDRDIIRDFIHEFKQRIKSLVPEYSKVYVLAPAQTKNQIVDAMPEKFSKKLSGVIEGNYFYYHPLDIVKKVTSVVKAPIGWIKPEAQKILEKYNIAKKKTG